MQIRKVELNLSLKLIKASEAFLILQTIEWDLGVILHLPLHYITYSLNAPKNFLGNVAIINNDDSLFSFIEWLIGKTNT